MKVLVDEDMVRHIQGYVEYCTALPGDIRKIEYHIDLSEVLGLPNQGGTIDYATIMETDGARGVYDIHLADLKYGYALVEVEENDQLVLYALGVAKKLERELGVTLHPDSQFHLHIYQPRVPYIADWTVTYAELLRLREKYKWHAQAIYAGDCTRTPGEKQCQYCAARYGCRERTEWTLGLCGLNLKEAV